MFRVDDVGPETPHLPEDHLVAWLHVAASAIGHIAAALTIVALVHARMPLVVESRPIHATQQERIDVKHIVFLAAPTVAGSGGGGGGNRQSEPIRHAQGVGSDAITLRVRKSPPTLNLAATPLPTAREDVAPLPAVVLDAKPMASGMYDQIGLPTGGVSFGTSTGPGSGGGVGTGTGTGIGPGRGPGIGPGSGGGIGGGVFRPGGAVSAPRVITEVKPIYTSDALRQRIQGTVVVDVVVTRTGRPSQIRVVRSLDPEGLDQQAIAAVTQWRFEPGRLAGEPVDVLVTIMLDFWIH